MRWKSLRSICLTVFFVSACAALSWTDTEGTLIGKIELDLYKGGTGTSEKGTNTLNVSIGDTLTIDAFLRNPQRVHVTGYGIYLTVDDTYFDVVRHGKQVDGSFMPFIQGEFLAPGSGSLLDVVGNSSHRDSLTSDDNGLDGWQLDYGELTAVDLGFGRPYSALAYGVAATFQLIAKAPCDSSTIILNQDPHLYRSSTYFTPGSNDDFSFRLFRTCYISVTGVEIDPPLPDILIAPGGIDNSLDLDDHISISSIPDSLLIWETSPSQYVQVSIDPLTRIVTFQADSDFRGYQDIVFSARDVDDKISASDTLRVTVDSPPAFTDGLPDIVSIYEDSTQVVFNLKNVVTDADDPYENLSFSILTGINLSHTLADGSLSLRGAKNYYGEETVTIIVSDALALADTASVTVVVIPVNDPPVFEGLPDVTIERNSDYTLAVEDYVSDVDGDHLTISWAAPDDFVVTEDQGLVTIAGTSGFLGSGEIVFYAVDPGGLSASDTMNVTISPSTILPVWTQLPKVGFAQGQADSSLVLWDYVSDADDPDSLLTFQITNNDDVDYWEVNDRNGKLALYDINNRAGWDRLTVTAYDPDGNFSSTQFIVFVAPADGTPIVGGIPDTTIVAGTQAFWIDLDDFYYDIDHTDDQMKWEWGRMADVDSSATFYINQITRLVTIMSISEDRFGEDKIYFTVTDPTAKSGDDICDITVLKDLTKPSLMLPAKVGFVTGGRDSLNLDSYVSDPLYAKNELSWSWTGNTNVIVTEEQPTGTRTRPVSFSGPAGWTGWERIEFTVRNPLGGAAQDTLLAFSAPDDGSPVAGGLSMITLRAGECRSVVLDNYFYDADTADYLVTWTVSGGDSVRATINALSHVAEICAHSETWQGQETLKFTVTDPEKHSASMSVPVIVTDAVLRNVFTVDIFRNPMQEDYMDFLISSRTDLSGVPTLAVKAGDDSTVVRLDEIQDEYYHGEYVLPLDLSLGVKGVAEAIMSAQTSDGRAVEDTVRFAYGYLEEGGGKIAFDAFSIDIPPGTLSKPVFFTVVGDADGDDISQKTAGDELIPLSCDYRVDPVHFDATAPVMISIASTGESTGLGIYREISGGREFIGCETGDGCITGMSLSGGTFLLARDSVAPVLRLLDDEGGGITVAASDHGSGIDAETITVQSDGRDIPWNYDSERSEITIESSVSAEWPDAVFDIVVSDRAGNRTVVNYAGGASIKPGAFAVWQNIPNPFNPVTHIPFTVYSESRVSVEVYDMLGRKIRVLADAVFQRRVVTASCGMRAMHRADPFRAAFISTV